MTKDRDEQLAAGVIAGYLDVKAPAHSKRRRFGPWKSWRRHWVLARSGPADADGVDPPGVELVLSPARLTKQTALLRIPAGADLCRTSSRSRNFAFVAAAPTISSPELVDGSDGRPVSTAVYLAGRSQAETERWMAALTIMLTPAAAQEERGVSVLVLETAWSRSVGLAGLHAHLYAHPGTAHTGRPAAGGGVVLRGSEDGRVRAVWSWSHLGPARLAGDSLVLLAANSSFPGGPGQIRMRAPSAPRLVRLLNERGCGGCGVGGAGGLGRAGLARSPGAVNSALLRGRRLSRSEGDLLAGSLQEPGGELGEQEARSRTLLRPRATLPGPLSPPGSPLSPGSPRGAFRLLQARRRAETLGPSPGSPGLGAPSPSVLSLLGGKIASGLISAGLGLILSTPGSSEVEDNDEDNDEDDNEVEGDHRPPEDQMDRRRESGVSVASGIYEEILDEPDRPRGELLYENALLACRRQSRGGGVGGESHYEDPRLLYSPRDVGNDPEAEDRGQAPPLPPRHNLTPLSVLSRTCALGLGAKTAVLDMEGDYVPMSPASPSRASRATRDDQAPAPEPHYLPMSPARPVAR